jgi:hypothetical protein
MSMWTFYDGRARTEDILVLQKLRKKKGLAVVEWGKHGIIQENGESSLSCQPRHGLTSFACFYCSDIYTKDQEFRAWLVGERMMNPETLSKAKEKEIFKVRLLPPSLLLLSP